MEDHRFREAVSSEASSSGDDGCRVTVLSRAEKKETGVDGGVVALEVSLLLEPLVADAADVLRGFPALVVQMPLQAALVPVGPAALVARERLRQEILEPRRRKSAP